MAYPDIATSYTNTRITFDKTAETLKVTGSEETTTTMTFNIYKRSITGFNSVAKAFTVDVYRCNPTTASMQLKFQKNSGVKKINTIAEI